MPPILNAPRPGLSSPSTPERQRNRQVADVAFSFGHSTLLGCQRSTDDESDMGSLRIRGAFRTCRIGVSHAATSILERVESVGPRHRHAYRSQRVENPDRVALGSQHIRQPLVRARCFIGGTTAKFNALP